MWGKINQPSDKVKKTSMDGKPFLVLTRIIFPLRNLILVLWSIKIEIGLDKAAAVEYSLIIYKFYLVLLLE